MLDENLCFDAMMRRDPGADGIFFVGVRTTGVYCRPICPVSPPLRRNIRFYATAAAAQGAGLRPCLRCRPESAPDSPAWMGSLATINRALRLIDEGFLVEDGVEELATRLGMTGRQLRRLFHKHLGVGPLAMEQARRLHLAKKLIHETALPLTDIAFAAGYGSIRRFNEVFAALFGRPPSRLRRGAEPREPDAPITVSLAYRPPLDWDKRLAAAADMGAVVDGRSLVFPFVFESREGRATLLPKDPGALSVRLTDVPVASLGRTIATLKRIVLSDLRR